MGFIGLGVMGGPQCANVCRGSGLPVTAFDLVPENVERAVEAGAVPASGVADVARGADLLLLSLPGGPQVTDVLYGGDGVLANARPGAVVVDLSTTPVTTAQEAHRRLADADVSFLDAPVARTRRAAVEGTLAIMVGGTPTAFRLAEPVLRTMGTEIRHCGPGGAGAMLKLLNNTVVFETVVALAEAVTVARRSGLVTDETLFDTLGSGSAASFVLENHGRSALLPDRHPTGLFPAAYMRKDLAYALEFAGELGLDLPNATVAHSLLERLCAEGFAENYHTSVVRLLDEAGAP